MGEIVILPGITSKKTRNPRRNFVSELPTLALHGINSESAGNYPLIDVESTERMGFPPEITSSGTINPPEEGDSTRNYQLIDSDSGR
jgi:hypothetical protein